ncbi:fimbrial outer membrane usher protein StbC [Salmonella enterica subsp. enterica]|uniref:Fimbrial outer membrane usher protein StbC n=1 Tax=Salmonella enterica I TaxID=59201 RepID=A0A447MX64_SALET|nr:fimbrial outer membrane usher protein StbC [Salmonella enterica subsp. enterica]
MRAQSITSANKAGARNSVNSKTFTTGTNLVLAAYRYSTNGFRDLQDVLGVRREAKTGIDYYSDTLHQRNRLSATVSQPLGRLGTLNLSASTGRLLQ